MLLGGAAGATVNVSEYHATTQDKNFNKFLAHYHQTQAKEKQYARLMKTHMADEKQDEIQVCMCRWMRGEAGGVRGHVLTGGDAVLRR
jgi:hypothetical protein